MENTFIGISENKMKHILAVAKESYRIAKEEFELSELCCRKAYTLGFVHDIGYSFSKCPEEHPVVGHELLSLIGLSAKEVLDHGDPNINQGLFLQILNMADMRVNSEGEVVGYKARLADIGSRYGKESTQYQNAYQVIQKVNFKNGGE